MKYLCIALAALTLSACQRSLEERQPGPVQKMPENTNRVPGTSCVLSHMIVGNRHVFVVQSTDNLPCSVATVD